MVVGARVGCTDPEPGTESRPVSVSIDDSVYDPGYIYVGNQKAQRCKILCYNQTTRATPPPSPGTAPATKQTQGH